MPEMRTYARADATAAGSATRWRPTLEPLLDCNCSICQKRGALWTYVEPADVQAAVGRRRPDRLPVQHPQSSIITSAAPAGSGRSPGRHGADGSRGHRHQRSLPGRHRSRRAEAHALRWQKSVSDDGRVGPRTVLRRAGLHRLPRLGAGALRARRDHRLCLRPAPRGGAGAAAGDPRRDRARSFPRWAAQARRRPCAGAGDARRHQRDRADPRGRVRR